MNCAAEEVAVVANGLNHHQAAGFAVFLLFSHDGETIEESGLHRARTGNAKLRVLVPGDQAIGRSRGGHWCVIFRD
tara:strand:- start:4834 stop:5061 length:228 start_codon:yes stop_codon:yes gene_type:complete